MTTTPMPDPQAALRARAEQLALSLWTNALSIYKAEVGNTRQREAAKCAVDYIAAELSREFAALVGARPPAQDEPIDDGSPYVFCDTVRRSGGCIRGAGHNGPHVCMKVPLGHVLTPASLEPASPLPRPEARLQEELRPSAILTQPGKE